MQSANGTQEGQNEVILQKQNHNEQPYEFSIVSNFNPEITASSSVPQAFIVSTENNVVTLISTVEGDDQRAFDLGSITTGQQLTSNGQMIELRQTNDGQLKQEGNVSKYHPLVTSEIILQADQSTTSKMLPESSLNQLQIAEMNQLKLGNNMAQYKEEITSMVLRTSQVVPRSEKYFFLDTTDQVEETIRKHTEETFSHFVVAKKTKAYGSPVTVIDTNNKFRIHWQSRDLTSTEECAVQIPFQGVPFIYIGEKAYMCHLGRNKSAKSKTAALTEVEMDILQTKRHRSRLTKKQGCPAKIFVKQIAKFPDFRIPCNSEYLRTQMSQKLRRAIMDSNGEINNVIQYVGTLPDISEHSNHDIGENTPVKEPIDPLIRDKIVELLWEYGDNAIPKQVKGSLEQYVCELFRGKTLPSKHRRRFYPSERDIANYIYKARLLSKLTCSEQDHFNVMIGMLRKHNPNQKILFQIEVDNQFPVPMDFGAERLVKDHLSPPVNEQKFLFVFQSTNQQRLLNLYGKQAILTEISKHYDNLPFPFYGVFVPTNVDYQLVHAIIIQSKSKEYEYLKQGLTPLVEWNASWTPNFFIVDFSSEQISVIEEMFPSCSVLISDLSREESWKRWLNNPENNASLQGNKDHVYDRLTAIANSYTEETLNLAAQNLENSEEWRLSESLRDWFSSDWLAEAKRWVAGYRHDDFMSTSHTECKLNDEIKSLCESHTTHVRNKKISDFISYLVKAVAPDFYQRYVEKNVSDYRTHYFLKNTQTDIPGYLEKRTASIVTHVIQQLRSAKTCEYTVSQVQTGIFYILDKADPNTTYAVSFGDATSLPSCVCLDWLKYKLPCKHMVTVFHSVRGWSWNMLSTLYTGNPLLSLDFNCIDKAQEDLFLANWKKENSVNVQSCINDLPNTLLVNDKQKQLNNELSPTNLLLSTPYPNQIKSPSTYLNPISSKTNSEPTGNNSIHFVNTLVSDCDNFCQELSNSIHQVCDQTILQKMKLDLQLMVNDVKLELSKASNKLKEVKRATPCNTDNTFIKKLKCDTNTSLNLSNISPILTNTSSNLTNLTDSNGSSDMPAVATGPEDSIKLIPFVSNLTKHATLSKCDVSSSPLISNSELSPKLTINETSEGNDVWIYDPELDIKLLRTDRENILNGQPLSLDILKSVQNILKHQFSDVEGLYDPEKLLNDYPDCSQITTKKKVLQLHMLGDNHWSASARTSQNICIFCCTLSSKATVIEQVLKMSANDNFGENILCIERIEMEDAITNCSLYAIAYSVAFLFDIEARNFVFVESEMRCHLAECLEDMCFSMFPVNV